jgi:hypothetical protein
MSDERNQLAVVHRLRREHAQAATWHDDDKFWIDEQALLNATSCLYHIGRREFGMAARDKYRQERLKRLCRFFHNWLISRRADGETGHPFSDDADDDDEAFEVQRSFEEQEQEFKNNHRDQIAKECEDWANNECSFIEEVFPLQLILKAQVYLRYEHYTSCFFDVFKQEDAEFWETTTFPDPNRGPFLNWWDCDTGEPMMLPARFLEAICIQFSKDVDRVKRFRELCSSYKRLT